MQIILQLMLQGQCDRQKHWTNSGARHTLLITPWLVDQDMGLDLGHKYGVQGCQGKVLYWFYSGKPHPLSAGIIE